MGIERDRVFHVNFEQGDGISHFVNLAKNTMVNSVALTDADRNAAVPPLFGDFVGDFVEGGFTRADFTAPGDCRPANHLTFEIRFGMEIPTANSDALRDLFGEFNDGTDHWGLRYALNAAGDRIEILFTQAGVERVFAFDWGAGDRFERDQPLRFRLTFDKTTMRAYRDGVKHGTDVTKASVMTGDWDDGDGSLFLVGAFSGGQPKVYFDHIVIERGAPTVLTAGSYTLETESFQDEAPAFPIAHSQGSGTGPGFKSEVLRISSGHETRETANLNNRNNFSVALINKTQLELENLIGLAHIMRGRGKIFRFKDWLEFQTTTPDGVTSETDQTIGVGDGANRTFQMTKTFFKDVDKSNIDHIRTIYRPVPGTVLVSVDDVLESAANYRVDHGQGRIIFNTAPLVGEIIKWGGEFDIPCRFNQDSVSLNMQAFENGQSTFDLIEVQNA